MLSHRRILHWVKGASRHSLKGGKERKTFPAAFLSERAAVFLWQIRRASLPKRGSRDRARSFASKMHLLHRQRYVLFGGVRTGF
jgi:hypothetical protein